MKICLFVVKNILACHYSLFGYRETLERMGHEVIDASFPGNTVQDVQNIRAKMPTVEQLMGCDVILSTYHEYVQPWLEAIYPFDDWKRVMAKVPVIARFDESMDRGDLQLPQRVPKLLAWATQYSWPAAQDAKKYGGQWLPYGADTTIFHPSLDIANPSLEGFEVFYKYPKKTIDLAFIGTLYQRRHEYLQKLVRFIGAQTVFHVGNVMVQDIEGPHEYDTTERLAQNYRKIKIFFCLPPMSRLIVEKVFDIMACDTMVMYPRFPGDAEENMSIFEDEKHIVYYELGFYANNGKQVKFYLENPEETERIARAGGELVRNKYSLEVMLRRMLEPRCECHLAHERKTNWCPVHKPIVGTEKRDDSVQEAAGLKAD